jgi:hypothetical protein
MQAREYIFGILAIIVVAAVIAGLAVLPLFILRSIYRFITAPPKKKKKKVKKCSYCINDPMFLTYQDEQGRTRPTKFCPVCGRRL